MYFSMIWPVMNTPIAPTIQGQSGQNWTSATTTETTNPTGDADNRG